MLIIEDEEAISMALEDDFQVEGYDVLVANNGKTGLEMAMSNDIDIILLDVMLPEMNGVEVCKTLRKKGFDTPIIMLTAKSQEIDRVLGLELGADDYVTKPFSPRELQARVKAVLRRSNSADSRSNNSLTSFGDVQVNFEGYQVFKKGVEVKLTALEFSLLKYFFEHKSKVLSRDKILDAVWSEDVQVDPRTVDTHVANLRKKLEDNPGNPRWLIGVRGIGYKFVA